MAGGSASGSGIIASPTSAPAAPVAPPVFVDTSLGTHVVLVVSPEETVADFKRKVCIEHAACFPRIGNVSVLSIKVRRKATYYHLSDSMLVRTAFNGIKGTWFVQMDMAPVTDSVINLVKDGEKLEKERDDLVMQLDSNIVVNPHWYSSPSEAQNGEEVLERERVNLKKKSDSDLLKGQHGDKRKKDKISNIMVNPHTLVSFGDGKSKTLRMESPSGGRVPIDGQAVGDEEGVIAHKKILSPEKSTKPGKKKHKKHREKKDARFLQEKEAGVAQGVDQLGILGELCSQLLDDDSVLQGDLIDKKKKKKKRRREETNDLLSSKTSNETGQKKKDSSFEEEAVPGNPYEKASTALKSLDENESKGLIHSNHVDLDSVVVLTKDRKKRRRSEINDHHIKDNPDFSSKSANEVELEKKDTSPGEKGIAKNPKERTSTALESHNGKESKDSVESSPLGLDSMAVPSRDRKKRKSKNKVKILDPPEPEIVNSEKMLDMEERDTPEETLEPVIAPDDRKTSKSRKRKSEKPDSSTLQAENAVANSEKMLEPEERDTQEETLEPVIASLSDHNAPPDDRKTSKSRKRKSEELDSSTLQAENAVTKSEKMLEPEERDIREETLEPVIDSSSDLNALLDDHKTSKSGKRKSEKLDSSTLQAEIAVTNSGKMLGPGERDTQEETLEPAIASLSDLNAPQDDHKTSKSGKRKSEKLDSSMLQAENAITNSEKMLEPEERDTREETLEPVIASLSDLNTPQDDHKTSKSGKRKSEKLDSSPLQAENAVISPLSKESYKPLNLRKRKSSNDEASPASSSHLSFVEQSSRKKHDDEIKTKVSEKGVEQNLSQTNSLRRSSRRLHNQRSANVPQINGEDKEKTVSGDCNQTTMIDGDSKKKDYNIKSEKSVSDNPGKEQKAILPAASTEATEDNSVCNKEHYRIAVRKVRKSKSNKAVEKSDQEEIFLNAGDDTFSHFSGSSSDGEVETKKNVSHKLDHIYPEDDATPTLVIRGPKAQSGASLSTVEASGDEFDLSQTSNTSKKRIALSVLLRGSNSYRKAKHGASVSQADDRDSQPVDFVPETQPEL